MIAIAMTTTLKVNEVDVSPGDAEATSSQVCRAQSLPGMHCKFLGVIKDDIAFLRTRVKLVLDINKNGFMV